MTSQVFDKQKGAGAAIRNFGSGSRRQFNFGSLALGCDSGFTTLDSSANSLIWNTPSTVTFTMKIILGRLLKCKLYTLFFSASLTIGPLELEGVVGGAGALQAGRGGGEGARSEPQGGRERPRAHPVDGLHPHRVGRVGPQVRQGHLASCHAQRVLAVLNFLEN